MSKFRFYIADISDGSIKGTNNEQDAKDLSASDNFYVVDSETGETLYNGDRTEVKEMKYETNSEENIGIESDD